MSDDVAMTTGGLSVQPGFGIFRRAAGGTQTVWVFNLLSGRKQAAVSDGIMGFGLGVGRGCGESAWVRCFGGVGEGGGGQASAEPLPLSADMGNEKGGGCFVYSFFFNLVFFFVVIFLPSQSSNGQLQRYERDKQTD